MTRKTNSRQRRLAGRIMQNSQHDRVCLGLALRIEPGEALAMDRAGLHQALDAFLDKLETRNAIAQGIMDAGRTLNERHE